MTRDNLELLFRTMKAAESDCSALHAQKDGSLDGSIAYHRAWKAFEKAAIEYNDALNEYVKANPEAA